jgi:hypothetical protein
MNSYGDGVSAQIVWWTYGYDTPDPSKVENCGDNCIPCGKDAVTWTAPDIPWRPGNLDDKYDNVKVFGDWCSYRKEGNGGVLRCDKWADAKCTEGMGTSNLWLCTKGTSFNYYLQQMVCRW